jgi:hypothetical protein
MERTLGSEQLEVADKRDITGSSISNRTRASADSSCEGDLATQLTRASHI